jgi:uridine phosphorylase
MDRRRFIEFTIAALAAGSLSLIAGCSKTETAPALANQEKLWKMTAAAEKVNEPVELAYVKNTPAFYRDASFGKEDPNFKPKTGGG